MSNFLNGIDKSKLRNGNNIVINFLANSHNMRKKLKIIFHAIKYKLGQFEKGTCKETEEENRFLSFQAYLDILVPAARLTVIPFREAEKELEFALNFAENHIIADEHFKSIL